MREAGDTGEMVKHRLNRKKWRQTSRKQQMQRNSSESHRRDN